MSDSLAFGRAPGGQSQNGKALPRTFCGRFVHRQIVSARTRTFLLTLILRRTNLWRTSVAATQPSFVAASASLRRLRAASAKIALGNLRVESQDDFTGACSMTGCNFIRYSCA